MIRKFFSYDGKFFGALTKVGEIIIANILFLVCCLPVVTAASSLTSFYYVTVKCVRKDRGTLIPEFFGSMKRTLGKGAALTVLLLLWGAALIFGRSLAVQAAGETLNFPVLLYDVLLGITVATAIYLFPVLSRFEMRLPQMVKLSFVMCLRYLPYTLLIAAGTALVGWLLFYKLPMACTLVLPGAWCLAITFLMEKALHHYMPKPEEGEEQWYDET